MTVRRSMLCLLAALIALSAGSALAIYQSDCPQICTPTCPCSVTCQGPFGPTTCGAAGEPCTGFAGDQDEDGEVLFAPSFLIAADADAQENGEISTETQDDEPAQAEETAEESARE